jgi:hypothetical protein
MNDERRFELYEKIYFHEVESREKLSSRLQIPLALLLSIASVYALIVKGVSFSNNDIWNICFGMVFLLSVSLFVVSVSYFVRSFYGHAYEFLPSASDTEKYRKTLIDTYQEYDDCDELVERYFNEYLFRYFNECSSNNTKVNDKRSEYLHKCNTYLILTSMPLVVSFLIFTFSGVDGNSIGKDLKVQLIRPIEISGNLDFTTLELDFSSEVKEILNARQTEECNASRAASSASEKSP